MRSRETADHYEKLSWDPWGRLISIATGSDTWKAVYDPLGRRLRTIHTPNGEAPVIATSLYDPSGEFLEIGVRTGEKTFWKVHGTNGLEAFVDEAGNSAGVISDALGNLIGISTNGDEVWGDELPSPYGARGPPPSHFNTVEEFAQAHAWRGLRCDPTGYLWMGARHYDPTTGRFLSPDPVGHPITLNLYTYANGDPINFYDPDGRFANAVYQQTSESVGSFFNELSNGIDYGKSNKFRDIFAPQGITSVTYDIGYFAGRMLSGYEKTEAMLSLPPDPSRSIAWLPFPGRGGKLRSTPISLQSSSQLAATEAISTLEVKSSEVVIRTNVTEAVAPYTRSNLKLGQQMHRNYKLDVPGEKEFWLPSGRRIDFLDIDNGLIYELKPNNPRAIELGKRQLQSYLNELKSISEYQSINWKLILETY